VHARPWLEETLASRLEAAEEANLQSLEEALTLLGDSREAAAAEAHAALEARLRREHDDEVAKADAAAAQQAQAALEEERERLLRQAEASVLEERAAGLAEVMSLGSSLSQMEETLQQEVEVVRTARAHGDLCDAILGLEDAFLAGREVPEALNNLKSIARETDSFVAQVLDRLPDGIDQQASTPCELLRQQFLAQHSGLVAAAFEPPGGGLLGDFVGRLFQWLYIQQASSHEALAERGAGGSADQAVRQNLEALRVAAPAVERGDLEAVLDCLDRSSTGMCRERAAEWMANVEKALQLRQALKVVKARAQCLTIA